MSIKEELNHLDIEGPQTLSPTHHFGGVDLKMDGSKLKEETKKEAAMGSKPRWVWPKEAEKEVPGQWQVTHQEGSLSSLEQEDEGKPWGNAWLMESQEKNE